MLFMRVCYEVLCAVLEYYFATKVIRSLKLFSNIAIWERVVLHFWYLDMSLKWVHSFGLDFSSLRFSLRAFPLRLLYMLRNFNLKHAMNRTAMNRDQAAFKRGLISVHFASPALVDASCCIILYRNLKGVPCVGMKQVAIYGYRNLGKFVAMLCLTLLRARFFPNHCRELSPHSRRCAICRFDPTRRCARSFASGVWLMPRPRWHRGCLTKVCWDFFDLILFCWRKRRH